MTITPSTPNIARVEQRETGWVVIYGGTVVGRHHAQYRAREQAEQLNEPDQDDRLLAAAREVTTLWRRLNEEGPGTPDDLELALDNAIAELECAVEEQS